ncbi:hypothetical protein EC12741_A0310 [Escherichia coli 1.2741]|nr:hypothetical protein EC12741_A0310 [Escherichia coli 1.2741]
MERTIQMVNYCLISLALTDTEVLRFDNFDDAVECCADLGIPFFVDAGNKKLVFWFVRVDDEGYPEIARCTEREFATIFAGISAGGMYCPEWARFTGRTESPRPSDVSPFCRHFQQGNRWLNWLEKQLEGSVRPVVIESVTKIMACGTTLIGYTQWCCSSTGLLPHKKDLLPV